VKVPGVNFWNQWFKWIENFFQKVTFSFLFLKGRTPRSGWFFDKKLGVLPALCEAGEALDPFRACR